MFIKILSKSQYRNITKLLWFYLMQFSRFCYHRSIFQTAGLTDNRQDYIYINKTCKRNATKLLYSNFCRNITKYPNKKGLWQIYHSPILLHKLYLQPFSLRLTQNTTLKSRFSDLCFYFGSANRTNTYSGGSVIDSHYIPS